MDRAMASAVALFFVQKSEFGADASLKTRK
jgi:hypothetical protein